MKQFAIILSIIIKLPHLLLGSAVLCLALTVSAAPNDPLQCGFLNPPDSAKSQIWWHWMNGNITKEGIAADLEAMHRIGISEANIITIGFDLTPRGPVRVMGPQFLDMVQFAAQEANRLAVVNADQQTRPRHRYQLGGCAWKRCH